MQTEIVDLFSLKTIYKSERGKRNSYNSIEIHMTTNRQVASANNEITLTITDNYVKKMSN